MLQVLRILSGFGADLRSPDNAGDNLLHLATALPGITSIIHMRTSLIMHWSGFSEEGRVDLIKWLLAKVRPIG